MTRLTELDYRADTAEAFGAFLDLPYCVLLDSSHGSQFAGRYDMMTADPYLILTTNQGETEIRSRSGLEMSREDPLSLLQSHLGATAAPVEGLPFSGGAIGYFAYDLGRRFELISGSASRDIDVPEMVVGLYDWAVVVDHLERRSWLVGRGRDPLTLETWDTLQSRARTSANRPRPVFEVLSDVQSNFSPEAYAAAFDVIKDHIRRGDCYQVNLTQRFQARVRGDSWNAYLALRQSNPAPYAGFMNTPAGQILCSSPESFLRVDGDRVETKPIKGTRPRSSDAAIDRQLAAELAASEKDRAENVMIVDLLRNDLGKSCAPGSIDADPVFAIESYANVHHLVSTVSGRLAPEKRVLDLLKACFPGGSITGAPKLSAMDIIDKVEPHRRSIYCGSLGYIGFDARMHLNITIRTLLRTGESIYAWAGGGIVADSELASEYQESFDKASALLAILTREPSARLA